ncbi:MAG: transcription factor S [Thermoplasmata archaeon]|jgi:DNA-directed RNA polymerase subunit M|nr:transcription factor S [Thermoplasmata archaeon]
MFCPNCKILLFPQDGKLVCRKCGLRQEPGSDAPQVVTHKGRDREVPVMSEVSDTLPTADVECPDCGNNKAYWVLRQTRAADEPETRIYRCVKCSHSWREY